METFTDQDLIDELQKYHQPAQQRREGGVTQQEWARAQDIDPRTAGDQLNEMMDNGILCRKRQRCEDGRFRFVYYKVE